MRSDLHLEENTNMERSGVWDLGQYSHTLPPLTPPLLKRQNEGNRILIYFFFITFMEKVYRTATTFIKLPMKTTYKYKTPVRYMGKYAPECLTGWPIVSPD